MGGMGGMLKMLPGMAGKITDEQLFEAEKRMKVTPPPPPIMF
jgi:signal recognition particle GTPase